MMRITECPRDAMQGIQDWIPTELKIEYLNQLLKCNFDVLDFGSFVSPKAIPQLKDTAEVLSNLKLSATKMLAIVANVRGAEEACEFEHINYLGFPFSISETFQQRNTNSSIEESLEKVLTIQELATKNSKELLIYISMGFGNPYGDPWHPEIVAQWTQKLEKEGIKHFALSDTIGAADVVSISQLFEMLIPEFPKLNIGAHLHALPQDVKIKAQAAIDSGCKALDLAIKGMGGCPMAKDDLTGNMDTIPILELLSEKNISHNVDMAEFDKAVNLSSKIFDYHH